MQSPSDSRTSAGAWTGAARWALWVSVAAIATGCIFDADDRCGPNQVLSDDRCVCAEGFGFEQDKCVACGENEVGTLQGCACLPGYARPGEGGTCRKVEGLGLVCTSDVDCVDEGYPYCHLEGEEGYCTTRDCTSSDQCEVSIDWACDTSRTPSFCERPPTGLGTPCSESADCEGFEASFCEAFVEKVCLRGGCKADPSVCHGDWVCCDITLLSESICIPPSSLEGGNCPAGGTLVPKGG